MDAQADRTRRLRHPSIRILRQTLTRSTRLYRQVLDARRLRRVRPPQAKRLRSGRPAHGALSSTSRHSHRLGRVETRMANIGGCPSTSASTAGVLSIGRTSPPLPPRTPALTTAADVIVTTASLEVGFDDPQVGAVLQHKAPRDIASFLQPPRPRGAAPQTQRPWTLVVLSDFGPRPGRLPGLRDAASPPALSREATPHGQPVGTQDAGRRCA